MKNLLIIGAGQYGMLTKELAESLNIYDKIDFLDDNNPIAIGKINDYDKFIDSYKNIIIAIGNPIVRKDIYEKVEKKFNLVSLISPKAIISSSAKLGKGLIIEPQSLINSNVEIGDSTLICAGAIINHNARIGNFCQINCGAIVKSNSIVEDNSKIDYGEII